MYKQAEKQKINSNKTVDNHVVQKKNRVRQGNVLVDNRVSPKIFQRAVNVFAEEYTTGVVIKARGQAKDFQNGDSAGNCGWNGVEKYRARVKVGDNEITSPSLSNNYLVAQAGHVLAEQNGGLGSDSDNVFAQDGGVNNATYRTEFENPMRRALNAADKKTKVDFRVALIGANIVKGNLDRDSDELVRSDDELYDTTASESSDYSDSD